MDNLIKIFTGTEFNVLTLKGILEENGILTLVKNDFQSGLNAGFSGGTFSSVELYINNSDLKKAEPLINEFVQSIS